ncbi:DUF932 domain-containing protein [Methylobacterium nodulans]|uniref:DUF945 domain-containing protein n=1 Tax=Methylobacterium nodulans (strain LMG 21967 / CNCM I-2342 / ORS 2060) TaxID=460265 RepID=B8IVF8_METNO|nr:DUF932 domain-containing protein [Methylobacterium nodulans]ACL61009.1 protein of unknown function DUF932 [Methylobacterium nodulans ORS 2060]
MFHDIRTVQTARITRFGSGAVVVRNNGGLDEAALRSAAPTVFAEDKHSSRSDKYTYIPTVEVLRGLGREGFLPVEVRVGGTRDEEKRGYTKHLLRLRRMGDAPTRVGDSSRELVLLNSHDGTSSYQLMSGLFRLICSNGLVCADGDAQILKIPHKGDIVQQVIDGAYRIVDASEEVDRIAAEMKQIELRPAEQDAFAEAAAELRWNGEGQRVPVEPRQIHAPRRREDVGNSLWLAFNRTQEGLIRGGIDYQQRNPETGRLIARRQTRPVQGVDGNTALNRALWVLANRMAELKAA